jgi:hypothetical protein
MANNISWAQNDMTLGMQLMVFTERETWLHKEEREDWKERRRSSHQNPDTHTGPCKPNEHSS